MEKESDIFLLFPMALHSAYTAIVNFKSDLYRMLTEIGMITGFRHFGQKCLKVYSHFFKGWEFPPNIHVNL